MKVAAGRWPPRPTRKPSNSPGLLPRAKSPGKNGRTPTSTAAGHTTRSMLRTTGRPPLSSRLTVARAVNGERFDDECIGPFVEQAQMHAEIADVEKLRDATYAENHIDHRYCPSCVLPRPVAR